jgi:hypothetical protein
MEPEGSLPCSQEPQVVLFLCKMEWEWLIGTRFVVHKTTVTFEFVSDEMSHTVITSCSCNTDVLHEYATTEDKRDDSQDVSVQIEWIFDQFLSTTREFG